MTTTLAHSLTVSPPHVSVGERRLENWERLDTRGSAILLRMAFRLALFVVKPPR